MIRRKQTFQRQIYDSTHNIRDKAFEFDTSDPIFENMIYIFQNNKEMITITPELGLRISNQSNLTLSALLNYVTVRGAINVIFVDESCAMVPNQTDKVSIFSVDTE